MEVSCQTFLGFSFLAPEPAEYFALLVRPVSASVSTNSNVKEVMLDQVMVATCEGQLLIDFFSVCLYRLAHVADNCYIDILSWRNDVTRSAVVAITNRKPLCMHAPERTECIME